MFLKIGSFWKNGDLVKNILGRSYFFSCDFDIFYGSIGCATKFHANEISFFLSISVRSKVVAFLSKFDKVEHTICDCNWLSQDIHITYKPFSSFHKYS